MHWFLWWTGRRRAPACLGWWGSRLSLGPEHSLCTRTCSERVEGLPQYAGHVTGSTGSDTPLPVRHRRTRSARSGRTAAAAAAAARYTCRRPHFSDCYNATRSSCCAPRRAATRTWHLLCDSRPRPHRSVRQASALSCGGLGHVGPSTCTIPTAGETAQRLLGLHQARRSDPRSPSPDARSDFKAFRPHTRATIRISQ